MTSAMQALYTFNRDDFCTSATNTCAHIVKKSCYINNLRFTRRILNDRTTVSLSCCQHGINRRSNTDRIHVDMSTLNALTSISRNTHRFVFIGNASTHRFKSFKVKVNRTWSQITTTRQTYCCLTVTSKQATVEIIRSTKTVNLTKWHWHILNASWINFECFAITLNRTTHYFYNFN